MVFFGHLSRITREHGKEHRNKSRVLDMEWRLPRVHCTIDLETGFPNGIATNESNLFYHFTASLRIGYQQNWKAVCNLSHMFSVVARLLGANIVGIK